MTKEVARKKVEALLETAQIAESLGDRRTRDEALNKAVAWEEAVAAIT